MKSIIAILAVLISGVAVGHAEKSVGDPASDRAPHINISSAWIRATPQSARVASGFLLIENTGKTDDRLLGGQAGFTSAVQIHEMKLVGEIARMRAFRDGLVIPAGGEVLLKPNAKHLMFMGLREQLEENKTVNVTLLFEHAGAIPVVFKVNHIRAQDYGDARSPAKISNDHNEPEHHSDLHDHHKDHASEHSVK